MKIITEKMTKVLHNTLFLSAIVPFLLLVVQASRLAWGRFEIEIHKQRVTVAILQQEIKCINRPSSDDKPYTEENYTDEADTKTIKFKWW